MCNWNKRQFNCNGNFHTKWRWQNSFSRPYNSHLISNEKKIQNWSIHFRINMQSLGRSKTDNIEKHSNQTMYTHQIDICWRFFLLQLILCVFVILFVCCVAQWKQCKWWIRPLNDNLLAFNSNNLVITYHYYLWPP